MQHTRLKTANLDLKPENILITDDEEALIGDLGVSSTGEGDYDHAGLGFTHTRAPECFLPDPQPTPASDVYGLFALIYRMVTGIYPFEDEPEFKTDATAFIRAHYDNDLNAMLQNKVLAMPLGGSHYLINMANPNPSVRPKPGEELDALLDKVTEWYDCFGRPWDDMRKQWREGTLRSRAGVVLNVLNPQNMIITLPTLCTEGPTYLLARATHLVGKIADMLTPNDNGPEEYSAEQGDA
jgi:serine/threonine protein kinase